MIYLSFAFSWTFSGGKCMPAEGLAHLETDGKIKIKINYRCLSYSDVKSLCECCPPLSVPSELPSVVGVAVAKRSSRNLFIGNLGGRRSCQSHMYSPAGWLLPHIHTLSPEQNSSSPCDPDQGAVLFLAACLLGISGLAHHSTVRVVCHFVFPQCTTRCFGKAVFLALGGICVKCVWEGPGRLQPSAVLTTTTSVTMATWGL